MERRQNIFTTAETMAREVLGKGFGRFRDEHPVPVGSTTQDRRQIRQDFESLTPAKLQGLVQLHGREAVNRWIGRELKLRERRGG